MLWKSRWNSSPRRQCWQRLWWIFNLQAEPDNESSNVWRCSKRLACVIVRCGQDNYLALKALKAEIAWSLDLLAACTEAICSGKDSTSNLTTWQYELNRLVPEEIMKMLDHPNLVAITAAWSLSLSTRGRCAFHVRASIIQLRGLRNWPPRKFLKTATQFT